MTPEALIDLAKEAMTRAYAPYSGYRVGAALLTADGRVYQGCNIENASFSPTVCAVHDFTAIAVVGGRDGIISGIFPPCGVCRQVMGEFCRGDFVIYLGGPDGEIQVKTLEELLPMGFSAQTHMGK